MPILITTAISLELFLMNSILESNITYTNSISLRLSQQWKRVSLTGYQRRWRLQLKSNGTGLCNWTAMQLIHNYILNVRFTAFQCKWLKRSVMLNAIYKVIQFRFPNFYVRQYTQNATLSYLFFSIEYLAFFINYENWCQANGRLWAFCSSGFVQGIFQWLIISFGSYHSYNLAQWKNLRKLEALKTE